MTGAAWYLGVPGSGKTSLAFARACKQANARRVPLLVIDTEGVSNFRGRIAAAPDLRAALAAVWRDGRSCTYTPHGREDFDAILRAVLRVGQVVLLIDEAAQWMTAHASADDPLLRIMRRHRHVEVDLHLTTQHLGGDVPQAALACAAELFVFRCTSPATLRRLQSDYGVDPARVSGLGQLAYLRIFSGFDLTASARRSARSAHEHESTSRRDRGRRGR